MIQTRHFILIACFLVGWVFLPAQKTQNYLAYSPIDHCPVHLTANGRYINHTLNFLQPLSIIKKQGDFYQISSNDSVTGWIHRTNCLTRRTSLYSSDLLSPFKIILKNPKTAVFSGSPRTNNDDTRIKAGHFPIYYVYQVSEDSRGVLWYLAGTEPSYNIDNIKQRITGWISSENVKIWDSRNCFSESALKDQNPRSSAFMGLFIPVLSNTEKKGTYRVCYTSPLNNADGDKMSQSDFYRITSAAISANSQYPYYNFFFCIDATQSCRDYIPAVSKAVSRFTDNHPEVPLQTGLGFYRDQSENEREFQIPGYVNLDDFHSILKNADTRDINNMTFHESCLEGVTESLYESYPDSGRMNIFFLIGDAGSSPSLPNIQNYITTAAELLNDQDYHVIVRQTRYTGSEFSLQAGHDFIDQLLRLSYATGENARFKGAYGLTFSPRMVNRSANQYITKENTSSRSFIINGLPLNAGPSPREFADKLYQDMETMLCTDKSMTDYLNARLFSRRFVPSGGCLTNILYPAYVRFMSDLSISADDFKFYRNNIYQDISFAELENRDTLTFFMLFNKKELLSAVGAMRAHASVNSADQLRQLTGFHAFSANSSCLDWLSRHYHLPLSKKRFPNTLKTIRISGLNDAQYDILADYLMETAEQIENILFNPYYPYRMILNSGSDNEFLFIDHINMP